MKIILDFLLTTFVTGFLIILPLLLSYLVIGQLLDILLLLTTPLHDFLKIGGMSEELSDRLITIIVLILICLLIGIANKKSLFIGIGNWIEAKFLNYLPLYKMLRNLSTNLSDNQIPEYFQPALIEMVEDIQFLGFIVEEHKDGKLTIFVPMSPTPGVGMIQIVNSNKVQIINAPMKNAAICVLDWGHGVESLVSQKSEQ